ncbi:LacI family DNA-binding transcriptional regulator [Carnobacteriaceae bacterium 52-44]|jgi:LacI family transcriptional regulator
MTVTIKDVAKKSGVAPSTVSRVIADSPSISQATKEKVRKVMHELNYFPNANAQGLASNRSKTIGVILPLASDAFYQNPFFPTVLRGINFGMSKVDYSILLSSGQTNEQRLNHIKKIVHGKKVEGLIFLYASKNDPLLDFALSTNIPTVVVGTPDKLKVHVVDNDNETIGKQATDYLIQKGCQNIAYIGGDMDQFFIKDRLKGYQIALEENNRTYKEDYIYNDFAFLSTDGYQLIKNEIDLSLYDGFVIADELVANGIQQALLEKKITQIRTITFKPFQQALYHSNMGESYINLHTRLLGSRAVSILFDSIENDNKGEQRYIREYVDGELVVMPEF